MALQNFYPTEQAASDALVAEGFTLRDSGFWGKIGAVDDFYGAYPRLALATIERRRVAPEYGKPDYYEVKFH